jgi:hypothetical protein
MKKILLPTDFSENALNAIDYALQLFKDVNLVVDAVSVSVSLKKWQN